MKILCISDLHFGINKKRFSRVYGGKLPNQKEILKKMGVFCEKKGVNILVIAGDIFDSDKPLKQDIDFLRKFFKKLELSDIKVLLISGNHEIKMQESFWKDNKFSENIFLLDRVKYIHGLQLENVNFVGRGYNQEICPKNIKKIKGIINILILHKEISGDLVSEIYPIKLNNQNSLDLEEIKKLNFEITILGHLHSFFRLNLGNKRELINCGSIMGKPFKNVSGKTGIILNIKDNKVNIRINKKWN
jgi:DNA repair exonuclease SbcCD nuclease subunit